MDIVKVNDKLYVGKQVSPADMPDIAATGIRLIINNRPDNEEAGQPPADAVEAAARAAGVGYVHIPVQMATASEEDVRRVQAALAEADGPALAHCRSGTRSLSLWALGEVLDGRMGRKEIRPFGERLGFDLKGAEAWLERNRP